MTSDLSLTESFLEGTLDLTTFRHADHLHVGFELLRAHDFSTAAHLFGGGLKALAIRAGRPDAYHQTITLAFLALIAERAAGDTHADFDAFAGTNPDLLDKTALKRWYSPERLNSEIARRVFLLPEAVEGSRSCPAPHPA
jgi:hypothetical protein